MNPEENKQQEENEKDAEEMFQPEEMKEVKQDAVKDSKKKHMILAVVVLVVLAVLGVLYFVTSSDDGSNEAQETDETVQQEANSDSESASDEEDESADLAKEEIDLDVIGDYEGTATATREYVGGTFTHTVDAAIGDPAEGKFYEGWLVVRTDEGVSFISTGKMEKEGDNYVLSYTAQKDLSMYNEVVITEETEADGLDNMPEDHVFEGEF